MNTIRKGIAYAVCGAIVLIVGAMMTDSASALSPHTSPTITYEASPVPNANGWNNTDVTVTFTCNDDFAVAYCTPPTTLSVEGANQTVDGTVMSALGTVRNITTSPINIDKTAPSVTVPALSRPFIVFQSREVISAATSDNLSGVTAGEYYIDADPGQGNGRAMQYVGGKLTATATLGFGLGTGRHTLYVRSQDKAGNWSALAARDFFVLQR